MRLRGHILCRGGDQGGCGEAEERGNARNQAFQVGAAHQERAVTVSCNHISIRKGVYQGGILLAEALLHWSTVTDEPRKGMTKGIEGWPKVLVNPCTATAKSMDK